MNESLPGLQLFQFSPVEAESLRAKYQLVLKGTDFGHSQELKGYCQLKLTKRRYRVRDVNCR